MNDLLSWGLVTGATLALIALGFNALQVISGKDEFRIATFWFISAGLVLIARFVFWTITTSRGPISRILVCVFACGFIVAATIEAVRYVNRKAAAWEKLHSPVVVASNPEPPSKPSLPVKVKPISNLACKRIVKTVGHDSHHASIAEGQQYFGKGSRDHQNYRIITAEICNEFSHEFKVEKLKGVTAQITYKAIGGETIEVHRGLWLSSGQRLDFEVNEPHMLIIAMIPERDKYGAFIFARKKHVEIIHRIEVIELQKLESKTYSIGVSLVSEEEGHLFKAFTFALTVTQGTELELEMVQVQG